MIGNTKDYFFLKFHVKKMFKEKKHVYLNKRLFVQVALDLSTKTGKHGGNILRPENKWVQTKNITTSRKIYFASAAENSISKFHEDQASTRMCESAVQRRGNK